MENVKARRGLINILQVMNDHRCWFRLLYSAEFSVIIKEEVKTFHDKNRFKVFMTTKLGLQKSLEEIFRSEEMVKHF